MKNANSTHYGVIYRTGGTRKFEWRRTLIVTRDYAEACKHRDEIIATGYVARVVNHAASLSIGLPETHCADAKCPCEKSAA